MERGLKILLAALASMALVAGALLVWESAPDFASDMQSGRPDATVWAFRCGAIAAVALAQAMIVQFVIGRLYPRRKLDDVLRIFFAATCALACAGAVTLGLAAH